MLFVELGDFDLELRSGQYSSFILAKITDLEHLSLSFGQPKRFFLGNLFFNDSFAMHLILRYEIRN